MAKITFDTQTCTRCGGTGHHSYCSMHGTTCFKCKGRKTTLSKRGTLASNAFRAERERLCGVTADTLTPGTRLHYDGVVRVVESIGPGGSQTYTKDGVTVTVPTLMINLAPRRGGMSEVGGLGLQPTSRVVLANTPEQWLALEAFADTLNGAYLDGQPSTATAKADAASAKRAATKAAKAALAVSA